MRRKSRLRNSTASDEQTGHPDYPSLHAWSVRSPDAFWGELWDFAQVVGERGEVVVEHLERMPGARWFPQARLNYAENLLRRRDDAPALIYRDESGKPRVADVRANCLRELHQVAAHLRDLGIVPGDRVAAIVPNRIETVVAMLATTALGAVWSSCSA